MTMADPAAFSVEDQRFRILEIPVDVTTMAKAVDQCQRWAASEPSRMVFVRETASLMVARKESYLKALHETADLVVPDGMPLVWIGRLRRYGDAIGRVSGADLVDALCERSVKSEQSHFFYGGKPGVAEKMAAKLQKKFPGLRVAGIYSPPMREIGPEFGLSEEITQELEMIRASNADFIWVGISSPKQEYWMNKAKTAIGRGVFLGVGAAFDFHSGNVKRAPLWMQRLGLEWLHRLKSEPLRLWRRYLVLAPYFLILALIDELRIGTWRR